MDPGVLGRPDAATLNLTRVGSQQVPELDTTHSSSPATRLPFEILSNVFTCIDTDPKKVFEISIDPSRKSLAHVCGYWRRVAFQCPTLWSTICVGYRRYGPEAVKGLLKRSGKSFLTVFVLELSTEEDGQCFEIVFDELHRIMHLQFAYEAGGTSWPQLNYSQKLGKRLPDIAKRPAPALRYLNLGDMHDIWPAVDDTDRDVELNRAAHAIQFPCLQELRYSEMLFDYAESLLIPSLTHLTIEGWDSMSGLSTVLRALRRLPLLQRLDLSAKKLGLTDVNAPPFAKDLCVDLPRLQELVLNNISGRNTYWTSLLQHLIIPVETRVSFQADCQYDRKADEVMTAVSQTLLKRIDCDVYDPDVSWPFPTLVLQCRSSGGAMWQWNITFELVRDQDHSPPMPFHPVAIGHSQPPPSSFAYITMTGQRFTILPLMIHLGDLFKRPTRGVRHLFLYSYPNISTDFSDVHSFRQLFAHMIHVETLADMAGCTYLSLALIVSAATPSSVLFPRLHTLVIRMASYANCWEDLRVCLSSRRAVGKPVRRLILVRLFDGWQVDPKDLAKYRQLVDEVVECSETRAVAERGHAQDYFEMLGRV